MRKLGICEEKGSGIDKVVSQAEVFQHPAPDFRVNNMRTTAILFVHQDFSEMSKADRIRACYQHCCLMYVSNQRMSNQSLRERFAVPESKAATVSVVISASKNAISLSLMSLSQLQRVMLDIYLFGHKSPLVQTRNGSIK